MCVKIITDKIGNVETERKANYYYQPWCNDAVPRYFYAKVNTRNSQYILYIL